MDPLRRSSYDRELCDALCVRNLLQRSTFVTPEILTFKAAWLSQRDDSTRGGERSAVNHLAPLKRDFLARCAFAIRERR